MNDPLALHVLTRSDLESGETYHRWARGEELALPTPQKRAMMLANPHSRGPDEPVQIIGTKGDRVIGRIDLIAGQLRAAGERLPICWGSQFFVPEADRSTMMGPMLLMKTNQVHHTLGAHGPSQMASPLYAKLKWAEVPLQRWVMLRKSRSVVRRYLGSGPLGGIARTGVDAALVFHRGYVGARRLSAAGGLSAERVERMPESFDSLLAPADDRARGERSAEWINWNLSHSFGGSEGRHERALYLVKPRGSDDVLGYFLLKVKFYPLATHRGFPDLTLATLADSRVFDRARCSDEALTLLSFVAAGELGADALEVCDPPGVRAGFYKSLGFLPAGTMRLFFRAVAPSPLADPRWKDPANWDIRFGDGENIAS